MWNNARDLADWEFVVDQQWEEKNKGNWYTIRFIMMILILIAFGIALWLLSGCVIPQY